MKSLLKPTRSEQEFGHEIHSKWWRYPNSDSPAFFVNLRSTVSSNHLGVKIKIVELFKSYRLVVTEITLDWYLAGSELIWLALIEISELWNFKTCTTWQWADPHKIFTSDTQNLKNRNAKMQLGWRTMHLLFSRPYTENKSAVPRIVLSELGTAAARGTLSPKCSSSSSFPFSSPK